MQCDVVFGLNLIIVKGGTHTYNMINDEQLPKKCHEERYRCSNSLEPYRPIVKINKRGNLCTEQGVQAVSEHTPKKIKVWTN